MSNYEIIETGHVPIKAWVRGVPLEQSARQQLMNVARLPFVHKWVAAMPDVHFGIGATVGSVIPTRGAIIPAAVGVDIGCGMMALRTTLRADQLPDNLKPIRNLIERAVPHGQTDKGGRNDRGSWSDAPKRVDEAWRKLVTDYDMLVKKHPFVGQGKDRLQLGTLGGGNHFIELCIDESQLVWVMLHSGSRGVGNRIGRYFIERAKKDMESHISRLPDKDLAYFEEGSGGFEDYVEAVDWAQRYARWNREVMMASILDVLHNRAGLPGFKTDKAAVNCHHNYVSRERHYDEDVLVTRKGAVSAREGELGIIPGSMGASSYIVRGRGNPESFHSCSHGAGRSMSRSEAKRKFTLDDHMDATRHVECRKDESVLDETPGAYKPIDLVMAAQTDLVEVVHTLRQVVCVKG